MRDYYLRMNVLWQDGRQRCVERQLPCDKFGFGRRGLAEEDPASAGRKRGYFIPTSDADLAKMTNAIVNNAYGEMQKIHVPIYSSGNNNNKRSKRNRRHTKVLSGEYKDAKTEPRDGHGPHHRHRKPTHPGNGENSNPKVTTVLPAMYQPVIASQESRFGPNAPNAIRRHEKRSAKMQRKYNSPPKVDANTSYEVEQYPLQNYSQLQQQQQQQQQGLSYNMS